MCNYTYSRGSKNGEKCERAKKKQWCCVHKPENMKAMCVRNRDVARANSKRYYEENREEILQKKKKHNQEKNLLFKKLLEEHARKN